MSYVQRILNGEDSLSVQKDMYMDILEIEIDELIEQLRDELTGMSRQFKYEMLITQVIWRLEDHEREANKIR